MKENNLRYMYMHIYYLFYAFTSWHTRPDENVRKGNVPGDVDLYLTRVFSFFNNIEK